MEVGNTKYGNGALEKNINGSNNSAFGICSSRDTDASWNTSFGAYANMSNISGISNVAIGTNSLLLDISGSYNTALGTATLLNNLADLNTVVGSNAMENNITGKENVAIGVQSGYLNDAGEKNIFIGAYSGFDNVNGSKNTFLGAETNIANSDKIYNNSTAIGYGSIIDSSNQIMLGTIEENIIIPGNAYLTNPTPNYTEQSIVSKKYIDTYVSGGIQITSPCDCATFQDVSLSGPNVPAIIDGVSLTNGMRVLIRCQDSSNNDSIANINNGIYDYYYYGTSSEFIRASDCSGNNVKGQATFIKNGNLNKTFIFVQTNYNNFTNEAIAGSYPLIYQEFYKISFSIGDGLEINGDTLQVKSDITNDAGDPYLTDIGILGTLNVGGNVNFNSNMDVSGTITQKVTIDPSFKLNAFKKSAFYLYGNNNDGNSIAIAEMIDDVVNYDVSGTVKGRGMYFFPNMAGNSVNSIIQKNDAAITSRLPSNANSLVLSNYGGPKNGIRISSSSITEGSVKMQSGNNSILVNATTNISITGDTSFNSFIDVSSIIVKNDASLNGKLKVNGDSNFNSLIQQPSTSATKNKLIQQIISGDVNGNPNKLKYSEICHDITDPSGTSIPTLIVKDEYTNSSIFLLPNTIKGSYNNIASSNGCAIISRGNAQNNNKFALSTWSSENQGLKMTVDPSSITQLFPQMKTELWCGNNQSIRMDNSLGYLTIDAPKLEISGNFVVKNNDASFNQKISVNGNSIFNSNVDISGNLIVKSDISSNNILTSTGYLSTVLDNSYSLVNRLFVESLFNTSQTTPQTQPQTQTQTFTTGYGLILDEYNILSVNESLDGMTYISANDYTSGTIWLNSKNNDILVNNVRIGSGTSDSQNTLFGCSVGINGNNNTFVGCNSGSNNVGNNNVFFGCDTGKNNNGDCNTLIGYKSDLLENVSYSTAIGMNAVATKNNQIVLGTDLETVTIPGKFECYTDISFNKSIDVSDTLFVKSIKLTRQITYIDQVSYFGSALITNDYYYNTSSNLFYYDNVSYNTPFTLVLKNVPFIDNTLIEIDVIINFSNSNRTYVGSISFYGPVYTETLYSISSEIVYVSPPTFNSSTKVFMQNIKIIHKTETNYFYKICSTIDQFS